MNLVVHSHISISFVFFQSTNNVDTINERCCTSLDGGRSVQEDCSKIATIMSLVHALKQQLVAMEFQAKRKSKKMNQAAQGKQLTLCVFGRPW